MRQNIKKMLAKSFFVTVDWDNVETVPIYSSIPFINYVMPWHKQNEHGLATKVLSEAFFKEYAKKTSLASHKN
jgi:hypothetical protein